MDRQEWDALYEQITALDAKMAAQVAALHATRTAAPPAASTTPTPSRPLRQERVALWRIAMLCKAALGNPAVRPEMHPYFVQIARVCREVVQRQEEGQGGIAGV